LSNDQGGKRAMSKIIIFYALSSSFIFAMQSQDPDGYKKISNEREIFKDEVLRLKNEIDEIKKEYEEIIENTDVKVKDILFEKMILENQLNDQKKENENLQRGFEVLQLRHIALQARLKNELQHCACGGHLDKPIIMYQQKIRILEFENSKLLRQLKESEKLKHGKSKKSRLPKSA
jgi:ubiquitin